MMRDVTVLAAVLAGGAGRRMGGGKPSVPFDGLPLVAHPLRALAAAGFADVVVVAKADTPLPPLGVPVIHDGSPVLHPFAGVVAALDHAGGRPVLVVGADMPSLTTELLLALRDADPSAAVVVASAGGEMQPLCARYGPSVRDALADALAREAPMRATLAALDPLVVEADERAVRNINTPEDLNAAGATVDPETVDPETVDPETVDP